MMSIAEQYKDKQLMEMECEVLPPDYQAWLDTQEPTIKQRDEMAMAFEGMQEAVDKFFSHPLFNRPPF